jgi:hypothetical protein
LKTVLQFGPRISAAVAAKPDGLLLHEGLLLSLFPLHVGMRQYWRDFGSLEAWARSMPHQKWWQSFVRDSGGTGFWHETYFLKGGMEAIYDDVPSPWDSCNSRRRRRLAARCSPRASERESRASLASRRPWTKTRRMPAKCTRILARGGVGPCPARQRMAPLHRRAETAD